MLSPVLFVAAKNRRQKISMPFASFKRLDVSFHLFGKGLRIVLQDLQIDITRTTDIAAVF